MRRAKPPLDELIDIISLKDMKKGVFLYLGLQDFINASLLLIFQADISWKFLCQVPKSTTQLKNVGFMDDVSDLITPFNLLCKVLEYGKTMKLSCFVVTAIYQFTPHNKTIFRCAKQFADYFTCQKKCETQHRLHLALAQHPTLP